MEHPARMALQPRHNLWMLVGGVVVHDGMHQLACGHLGFDGIQEADELLVPMALHAAADDATFQHVQGGKQCGGAVPDVVVLGWTAADGIDVPE